MSQQCTHLDQIQTNMPATMGCEECLKLGEPWVLLRMCRSCGHVGCCDTSRHKHATQHFRTTGHPIAQLLERAEETDWCYVDQIFISVPSAS